MPTRQPSSTTSLPIGVTHAFFVPAVIQAILDVPGVEEADLSSLELLVYGAAPIGDAVLRRAIDVLGCRFLQAYGMTETAGAIVALGPRRPRSRRRPSAPVAQLRSTVAVGRGPARRSRQHRQRDTNRCRVGEVGEIWTRSAQNTPGYRNRPEATAEALTDDGWLRTGDAAYADEDGYLFLFDRFKDMIVSGAENVYPAEVENVLYDHPDIAEVAVIGVPNEKWGETVKAIVVARPGHTDRTRVADRALPEPIGPLQVPDVDRCGRRPPPQRQRQGTEDRASRALLGWPRAENLMTLLDDLCQDLRAEGDELAEVLAGLDEAGWETMTAAQPWRVKDQISHLAWNDDATVRALTQPDEFLAAKPDGMEAIQAMVDQVIVDYHHVTGTELLSWFQQARGSLLDAFAGRNPKERMPWYGPEMSLASKLTARFMESWAHGYDVFAALGQDKPRTDRVRHVVFLGLQALPNAYTAQGRDLPDRPVRLEVTSPSGELWQMGPAEAEDVVRGSAFDLALVVTQRLNVSDADLQYDGPIAAEWLQIAQAFAGPPGAGR